MAKFCNQCAVKLDQPGDFAGLVKSEDWEAGIAALVLCDGCGGRVAVNPQGDRVDMFGSPLSTWPKDDLDETGANRTFGSDV